MIVVEIGAAEKLAKCLAVLPTRLLGHVESPAARSARLLVDIPWKHAAPGPQRLASFEADAGWSVSPISDDCPIFLSARLGWCPDDPSVLCKMAALNRMHMLNGLYSEHEALR
jgi:hypothetical protein